MISSSLLSDKKGTKGRDEEKKKIYKSEIVKEAILISLPFLEVYLLSEYVVYFPASCNIQSFMDSTSVFLALFLQIFKWSSIIVFYQYANLKKINYKF